MQVRFGNNVSTPNAYYVNKAGNENKITKDNNVAQKSDNNGTMGKVGFWAGTIAVAAAAFFGIRGLWRYFHKAGDAIAKGISVKAENIFGNSKSVKGNLGELGKNISAEGKLVSKVNANVKAVTNENQGVIATVKNSIPQEKALVEATDRNFFVNSENSKTFTFAEPTTIGTAPETKTLPTVINETVGVAPEVKPAELINKGSDLNTTLSSANSSNEFKLLPQEENKFTATQEAFSVTPEKVKKAPIQDTNESVANIEGKTPTATTNKPPRVALA